jgi:hypothetical protein
MRAAEAVGAGEEPETTWQAPGRLIFFDWPRAAGLARLTKEIRWANLLLFAQSNRVPREPRSTLCGDS